MAAELIVCGRQELPPHEAPWSWWLENDDGSISLDEVELRATDSQDFVAWATKIVGWEPRAIVCIRKAGWDGSEAVAEELASALEGAVFCDFEETIQFDAKGKVAPARSIAALEGRLRQAFNHPQPYIARWERAERERFDTQLATDASLAADNDWSDVLPADVADEIGNNLARKLRRGGK